MTPRPAFARPPGIRPAAGASARREAARRRQEAERLLREVELLERGADGEERTAATLAWLPPVFTTIHDLRLPGSPDNLDHLVIGPTGVFAVDTAVHDGTVRYGTGTLWRGDRSMRAELHALAFEATRLAAVLDTPVVPVASFALGDLPRRELTLEGTRVLALADLVAFIVDRPVVAAPHELERLMQEAHRLARRPARRPAPPGGPAATDALGPTDVEPAGAGAAPDAVPAALRGATRQAVPAPTSGRAMVRIAAGLALVGAASYAVGVSLRSPARSAPATVDAGAAAVAAEPSATAAAATADAVADVGRLSDGLALAASCPGSGLGWTVTPMWPGAVDAVNGYDVAWRAGDGPTWVPAGRWSTATQPPPIALGHLGPHTSVTIRLVGHDGRGATVARIGTVSTPADAC